MKKPASEMPPSKALARPLASRFFMTPRDIGLFLMSARTDATIARLRATDGARAAFEAVYSRWNDPWAAASPLYRYQRRKYEQVVGMLAGRHFRRALDLGCGLGLLAQLLAPHVDELLGLDIAEAAVERARQRAAAFPISVSSRPISSICRGHSIIASTSCCSPIRSTTSRRSTMRRWSG